MPTRDKNTRMDDNVDNCPDTLKRNHPDQLQTDNIIQRHNVKDSNCTNKRNDILLD